LGRNAVASVVLGQGTGYVTFQRGDAFATGLTTRRHAIPNLIGAFLACAPAEGSIQLPAGGPFVLVAAAVVALVVVMVDVVGFSIRIGSSNDPTPQSSKGNVNGGGTAVATSSIEDMPMDVGILGVIVVDDERIAAAAAADAVGSLRRCHLQRHATQ
jgi:hypothetical protein